MVGPSTSIQENPDGWKSPFRTNQVLPLRAKPIEEEPLKL